MNSGDKLIRAWAIKSYENGIFTAAAGHDLRIYKMSTNM